MRRSICHCSLSLHFCFKTSEAGFPPRIRLSLRITNGANYSVMPPSEHNSVCRLAQSHRRESHHAAPITGAESGQMRVITDCPQSMWHILLHFTASRAMKDSTQWRSRVVHISIPSSSIGPVMRDRPWRGKDLADSRSRLCASCTDIMFPRVYLQSHNIDTTSQIHFHPCYRSTAGRRCALD